MAVFTKNDFKELAEIKKETCISIYIPTHRGGQEVLDDKDRIKFKTQYQEVEKYLEKNGKKPREIEALLKHAKELEKDDKFWRHQSDGLAFFSTEGFSKHYTLPVRFEASHYVGKRFHLRSLTPLLNENNLFYILNISRSNAQLFEAKERSIAELNLKDYGPTSIEEVSRLDNPQDQIQQHSGGGNTERAMTHGHGEGKDISHRLLKNFVSRLDDAIMEILSDCSKKPLVLAGVDDMIGHYREASNYPNIYEKTIRGNHDRTDMTTLHEKTVKILQPYFEEVKNEQKKNFKALQGTGKAESNVANVVKSSVEGMVDHLFIANKKEVWGNYLKDKHEVSTSESKKDGEEELLNYAAIQTILKGGNVYLVDPDEMPESESPIAAVYRNA